MKSLKLALLTAALALPLASISPSHALTISNLVSGAGIVAISDGVERTPTLLSGRGSAPLSITSVQPLVGGSSVEISNLLTATITALETGLQVDLSEDLADAFDAHSSLFRSDSTLHAVELRRGLRAGVPPELSVADSIYLGLSGPPTGDLYPWFLVDISGWDGRENLEIQNFWPGASSVVSIFTATAAAASVPDGGGTLVLTAVGLMALAGLKRSRRLGLPSGRA